MRRLLHRLHVRYREQDRNDGRRHRLYPLQLHSGQQALWRGAGTFDSNAQQWTTDEVIYWSPAGQRLATYPLVMYQGAYGGPPPSLYCNQTGTNYYFGSKLLKNVGGWVYTDRLGSIGKFYPYGQERPSATANGKEKFATYFRDSETGLDYADQRYESPSMGRFLTADPFIASDGPSDPGSWNRYAYTRADPINRIDPEGLADFSVTGHCGAACDGSGPLSLGGIFSRGGCLNPAHAPQCS